MKILILAIFVIFFTSCSEDKSMIAEVRNVVTKKSVGSDIDNFYGDYTVGRSHVCCYRCEITQEEAQKVLKNKKVFKTCTNTSSRIAPIYIGVTIVCTLLLLLFLAKIVKICADKHHKNYIDSRN